MLSSAYLQKSRNGVYFARFVVPEQQRVPADGRDFKLSTGTKDPRHAKAAARRLGVLFDGFLLENATVARADAVAYLQASMKKQTVPPMPFGVERTAEGWKLTDLTTDDMAAAANGGMDGLISALERNIAPASIPTRRPSALRAQLNPEPVDPTRLFTGTSSP